MFLHSWPTCIDTCALTVHSLPRSYEPARPQNMIYPNLPVQYCGRVHMFMIMFVSCLCSWLVGVRDYLSSPEKQLYERRSHAATISGPRTIHISNPFTVWVLCFLFWGVFVVVCVSIGCVAVANVWTRALLFLMYGSIATSAVIFMQTEPVIILIQTVGEYNHWATRARYQNWYLARVAQWLYSPTKTQPSSIFNYALSVVIFIQTQPASVFICTLSIGIFIRTHPV